MRSQAGELQKQRMRCGFAVFHIDELDKVFALQVIQRLLLPNKAENFPFYFLFNYWEVKR